MRTRSLLAMLLCLPACTRSEAPKPQARARTAPVVAQGRPAPVVDPAAMVDAVEVQLRTGRTRVGEAVRVHVSAWRTADGASFDPSVEIVGSATVERVGEEIIEERDGRVRERIDFLIEPSGPGELAISVSAVPPLERESPTRQELTLLVAEAMPAAELEAALASESGRLERGRMLARQGDYARAIDLFNRSLERRRDDPVVLSELGWAAFLAGDATLARRATREALRHQTEPRSRGALLYNLGRIAESLERDDEAIAAYRRSLEVRPDSEPVRERLARLEAARATSTCAAPSCPLTPAVDAIRACELIEEEACPLFRQRGACRCDFEALTKLDAIGSWRLWTLTEPDDEGLNAVYMLLADAVPAADEPRYHVFAPLPGSHYHGELRGGVRAAELIEAGGASVLRIDFEGSVSPSSLPGVADSDADRLARAWTVLCKIEGGQPVCAAPISTAYQTADAPVFRAPIAIAPDGNIVQTIASGEAPDADMLALEFPGAGMRVLAAPTSLDRWFSARE